MPPLSPIDQQKLNEYLQGLRNGNAPQNSMPTPTGEAGPVTPSWAGTQEAPTIAAPAVPPAAPPAPGAVKPNPATGTGALDFPGALAVGLGGLADAFSAGGGNKTNHSGDALKMIEEGPERAMAAQERGRAIQTQKEQDDPNSNISQAQAALLTKFGIDPAKVKGLSYTEMQPMAAIAEKTYGIDATTKERLMQAQIAAQARTDVAGINASNRKLTIEDKDNQHQDALETQAINRITSIRGDTSLKNAETQRDAAATAYNRIKEISASGNALNPVDYVDILGQIYKARTGAAPTNEVLQTARQATLKGDLGKAYTYLTGNQAPATTQNIMSSLSEMAKSMGSQADKFHDGYMKAHLIKPSGLANERWQNIVNTNRGMSFAEATKDADSKSLPPAAGRSPKPGGVLKQDKNGNKAWVYPDGTFDEVK